MVEEPNFRPSDIPLFKELAGDCHSDAPNLSPRNIVLIQANQTTKITPQLPFLTLEEKEICDSDNEEDSIQEQALRLINDQVDADNRRWMIDSIREIRPNEREAVLTQALRLINDQTNPYQRRSIIAWIREIPPSEREAAVTQALLLINDQVDADNRRQIIDAIRMIPPNEREAVLTQALRLINDQVDADNRRWIIDSIKEIPPNEREAAVTQALLLINDQVDASNRRWIIDSIREIPPNEREAAVTQALRLINNQVGEDTRASILSRIRQIPAAEREDEVSRILGLNNAPGNWMVNLVPFEISQEDIANQPRTVLLNYANCLQNRIPRVEYLGSPGFDQGGLTRDFITRLFQALFPKMSEGGNSRLQAVYDDLELSIPQTLNADDLEYFRAVGSILGEILAGRLQATTGVRFSPILFDMLHALTEEEIRRINEPEFHTSAYRKILGIYCKARYTWLTEQEINEIVQGRLPQRMQINEVNTYPNFILESGIGGIISAIFSIASGIAAAVTWDRDKKATPVELGEAIQGQFSKETVIEALSGNADTPQKQFLVRWINESNEAEVRRFLVCISGAETVGALPLNIHPYEANQPRRRPSYHACSQQIDLPDYANYDLFKELLEESLNAAEGFQAI